MPAPPPLPLPPFDTHTFAALLLEQPARAAAVLAAMRPQQRAAQMRAHAALTRFATATVEAAWDTLIARHRTTVLPPATQIDDTLQCVAVYDTAVLDEVLYTDRARARAMLGQLSSTQRVTQASAYAAWMEAAGFPITVDEVLAWWSALYTSAAS